LIRRGHRVHYGSPLEQKYRVDDGGCWVWLGARNEKGYGNARCGGTVKRAHLVVYEKLVGPVPRGKEFHHLCHNRLCVNPAHGEWIEPREHRRRS
jgi:hypothetical protein